MFKQVVFPIRFDRMLIIHFVYVLNFATFVSFFAQKKILMITGMNVGTIQKPCSVAGSMRQLTKK